MVSLKQLHFLVLKLIAGPQSFPEKEEELFEGPVMMGARPENMKKKVLVYFIGGVTFAEIAAIRFLNARPDSTVKLIVATTQIISGNKCVNQMRTSLVNKLDPMSLLPQK